MRDIAALIGLFVLFAIAIAWPKFDERTATRTEVPATSPHGIMKPNYNLMGGYWTELF